MWVCVGGDGGRRCDYVIVVNRWPWGGEVVCWSKAGTPTSAELMWLAGGWIASEFADVGPTGRKKFALQSVQQVASIGDRVRNFGLIV